MRSPEDTLRDLEADRLTREGEIRLIENLRASLKGEAELTMLNRSLVLLTYAHFEGFCKFALLTYVEALNGLSLTCGNASTALAAASLHKLFAALKDPNSKHPLFATSHPEDRDLHMLWRHRTFVSGYEGGVAYKVELADAVVNTESNLNCRVLKRNLYVLGLDEQLADIHRATIDRLLGVRNAIAHGDTLKRPTSEETSGFKEAAFDVMGHVQTSIFDALSKRQYLKQPHAQVA